MSVAITLFKALEDLSPKNYKGYFGSMKNNHERIYGVFLKGGTPGGRVITDGSYSYRSAHLTINVNASKSADGILEGYDFCETVLRTLEKTANYIFVDPDTGKKVQILSVDTIGDVNSLGFNSFDIPSFSLNFIIKYQGGN